MTLRGDVPELAPHVHGADGLGNTGLPEPRGTVSDLTAVEMIVAKAREFPGELHLVATGPLTNLAGALACEPNLVNLVASVTVMGGAVLAPGNQTPAAEANIMHDPEAAQAVLSAPWPLTLVPLDVTMREIITEEHRSRLAGGNRAARLVAAASDHYFDFFHQVSFDRRCSPCHDALAAAICVGDVVPILAPSVPVVVECGDGPGRGATIADLREMYRGFVSGHTGVSVVLETEGTFADLLVEKILSGWES